MASLNALVWLLALSGGTAAGLLAGLFGVGGGLLVVPLLLWLGLPVAQAVALSLIYIFFTSLSGTRVHWQQGSLVPRAAAYMGVSALFSAAVGVWLTGWIPQQLHLGLFIAFLLFTVGLTLWPRQQQASEPVPTDKKTVSVYLSIGLLAGLLASLFGVGGGAIMVPLLLSLTPLSVYQATGSSLGAVVLISLGTLIQQSLFGSLQQVAAAHWLLVLLMSLAGMLAAPWGARLNRRLPAQRLKTGFLGLMLLIIISLLLRLSV